MNKITISIPLLISSAFMSTTSCNSSKNSNESQDLNLQDTVRLNSTNQLSSVQEWSINELITELNESAHGGNDSELIKAFTLYSNELDESKNGWNGTSEKLASRFNEFAPHGIPSEDFHESFGLAGRESDQKPEFEVEALVRIVGSLSLSRPDLLQFLLLEKSKNLEQKESDLFIYASALEYVNDNPNLFRAVGFEGIKSLSMSENPIYRLLSAKVMPALELDLDSLAEFYRAFLNESDETILLATIHGLKITESSAALDMLNQIRNENHSLTVIDAANNASAWISLRQSDQ